MAEGGAGGAEVGRISVRVVPNLDKFYGDVKDELERIETELRGKIHFDADLDEIREKIKAETSDLHAPIHVDPDMDGFREKVRAETALLPHAKVKVDADVSGAGAAAGLSGAAGASHALGGFGGQAALITAAVVALGGPALALLSGALLALPAILTAVVAPIGVVALGLDGIKKAAEGAGLIGEGKKGKTTLGQSIKDLQASVSQVFQTGLTPVFQQLATLMPVISTGAVQLANGLVGVAQGFTRAITSSAGVAAIKDTFDGIAKAMAVSTPGIEKFTGGILNLIGGGSKALPAFAQLFTDAGTAFDGWISKITKPTVGAFGLPGKSELQQALDNMIPVLKDFGGLIGDLFTQGFEWLKDPEFAKSMKDFVDDVRSLVKDTMPLFKDAFTDIGKLVHDIRTDIDSIKNNVPDWLKDKPKNPDKKKDPNALGDDNPFQGLPQLKLDTPDSFLNAISFATIPTLIAEQLSKALPGLVNVLSQAWQGWVFGAQLAAGQIGTILSEAWQGLVFGAQTAIGEAASIFNSGISTISGIISGIGAGLSGAWDGVVASAQAGFSQLPTIAANAAISMANGFISGINGVISAINGMISSIIGAFGNLAGQLQAAGAAAMQGLINGIASAGAAAIAKARDIAGQIAGAFASVLQIHSPSVVMTNIGINTMQGLQNGLEGGFQGVLDRAKAMAGQIADGIKNGILPPNLKGDLTKELKEIGLEYDQLKVQRDNTTDPNQKKQITDQLKQLSVVRDQLNLQQKQLGYSQDYGNSLGENNQMQQQLGQSLNKGIGVISNFAMANVKQAESDLGISGQGAIPKLADIGLGWGTQLLGQAVSGLFGGGAKGGGTTHIHVNNIDDALAAKKTTENQQALQWVQRT